MTKEKIAAAFSELQDEICFGLERVDGKGRFKQDLWERPGGGGGKTRVLSEGDLIEKGGVNFSAVHGAAPEAMVRALKLEPGNFFASGVSIVLHPHHPLVPIIHMNVRYFEMENQLWWFGGGIDLTPHYIDNKEAGAFHQDLKQVCDRHHPNWYAEFKAWADRYFYSPHREETRGVGGIFFDHLNEKCGKSKSELLDFTLDVGRTFVPAYEARTTQRNTPIEAKQKDWQYHRRGRYVEFNLLHDRGTKFGIDSHGRTESILMSLPPMAAWTYMHEVPIDSPEAKTLAGLRQDIPWIEYA
jgi:coproporphyrinogen III oxidase